METVTPPGPSKRPGTWHRSSRATTSRRNDPFLFQRSRTMTAAAEAVDSQPAAQHPTPPLPVPDPPLVAAVAVVPILATVYQTLVLTDVIDDVIRKGIEAEHYSTVWTSVCWRVSVLYGVSAGIWAMARFGARDTLLFGRVWF